jgi:hypothetical protein
MRRSSHPIQATTEDLHGIEEVDPMVFRGMTGTRPARDKPTSGNEWNEADDIVGLASMNPDHDDAFSRFRIGNSGSFYSLKSKFAAFFGIAIASS